MIFSKVVSKVEQALTEEPSDSGEPVAFARNSPPVFNRSVPISADVQAIVNAARAVGFNLVGAGKKVPAPDISIPIDGVCKGSVLEKEVNHTRNDDRDGGASFSRNDAGEKVCETVKDSDSDDSETDSLIPEEWLAFRYCDLKHHICIDTFFFITVAIN